MLKNSTTEKIDELIKRYEALAVCREDIIKAVDAIAESYRIGGKLLICGNGGSAADSEHITGELMKGFLLKRHLKKDFYENMNKICPEEADYFYENLQEALPAISLVSQIALNTAFSNDQAADLTMAQQVLGLGREGDVLLGISTSGNSANIFYAVKMARVKNVKTIALTGRSGGKLRKAADILITVPEEETYKIQELHLPVYHSICIAIENEFFENN